MKYKFEKLQTIFERNVYIIDIPGFRIKLNEFEDYFLVEVSFSRERDWPDEENYWHSVISREYRIKGYKFDKNMQEETCKSIDNFIEMKKDSIFRLLFGGK